MLSILLLCFIHARPFTLFPCFCEERFEGRVDRLQQRHRIFLLQLRSPLLFADALQVVQGVLSCTVLCPSGEIVLSLAHVTASAPFTQR